MENQEEQQEYFAEVSSEYDKKYQEPEKVIDYEKVHRLETALELINDEEHERVVEIGVGSGEFFREFSTRSDAELVGLDISFPMIQAARKNETAPEYCQGTATDIPLSANSVDLLVCLGVIGYTEPEEMGEILEEFERILRPGGQLILSFANQTSPYRQFRQLYYYKLLEFGKQITGLGTPATSGYNTFKPSAVCGNLQEAGFDVSDFRYLTFSTGIWNTSLNIQLYKFLDRSLSECDFTGKLGMTWVVAAQKPTA